MAKDSWLIIDQMSGSGNATIKNSASAHTGRVSRRTTVTITGVGVTTPATYSVVQEAKNEYVSFDDGAEMSFAKEGGTVTITGKTNSSKLNFAWVGSSYSVTIPTNYTANGTSTRNNVAITGDPGATSEFSFSITFTGIPANSTVLEIIRTLKVTANGGQAAQIAMKQAAGDAYLEVDTEEIIIPQNGDGVSVNIISNTSWTIS